MSQPIPGDFEPLSRSSPFLDRVGPLYMRRRGDEITLGLRIEPHHTNNGGTAHGGLLVSLADLVLGLGVALKADERRFSTVSMSVDYAGAARVGDWVEGRADVQRVGRNLAFAGCYLCVGERRILRASAVFTERPGSRA